eukprot:767218-Hanusia_phi.AAC.4
MVGVRAMHVPRGWGDCFVGGKCGVGVVKTWESAICLCVNQGGGISVTWGGVSGVGSHVRDDRRTLFPAHPFPLSAHAGRGRGGATWEGREARAGRREDEKESNED